MSLIMRTMSFLSIRRRIMRFTSKPKRMVMTDWMRRLIYPCMRQGNISRFSLCRHCLCLLRVR